MVGRIGRELVSGVASLQRTGSLTSTLSVRSHSILQGTFGLQAGQRVLIVYDHGKKDIAKAFVSAAQLLGAHVTPIQLKECRFANGGLEEILARVHGRPDVCLNFFSRLPEETSSRVALLKLLAELDIKTGHGPGITKGMLMVDFDFAKAMSQAVALKAAFKGADHVLVTSALGTHVRIDIRGREFVNELTTEDDAVINLPNGEIFCAPIETGANGVIVADGTIGDFGLPPAPIRIAVTDGMIARHRGHVVGANWLMPNQDIQHSGYLQSVIDRLSIDKKASVVGELGIGLMPFALCGDMLQDEKAAKTCHIAFGSNDDFGGHKNPQFAGLNDSAVHMDFLIKAPTIVVYYPNEHKLYKPPVRVMEVGRILV